MKITTSVLIFLVAITLGSKSYAEPGPLRRIMAERWMKRQAKEPPPQALTDVTSPITKPGLFTYTLKVGEVNRYYMIYIPKAYDAQKLWPLLFVFHGGGGDMSIQAEDQFYGQLTSADSHGFIAVFPNGTSPVPSGKLATWNAGECCGKARDQNVDDIAFIKALVKTVETQTKIDKSRIYAAGMSNGGMMTYRLACEMPDVFAGIASVAGTDNTKSCAPTKQIRILHIHAKNDDHVLFNGGAGKDAFRDASAVTNFTSVPATLAKWKKLNGCKDEMKAVLIVDGAKCEAAQDCKNEATVQLCTTDAGGHSWPGGKKPRGIGSSPSTAIRANDVMWNFFDKK